MSRYKIAAPNLGASQPSSIAVPRPGSRSTGRGSLGAYLRPAKGSAASNQGTGRRDTLTKPKNLYQPQAQSRMSAAVLDATNGGAAASISSTSAPAANHIQNRLAYDLVLMLKKFLLTLKRGEQIVEAQRQVLAMLPEFEPHACFQRLDRDGDGLITSVELIRFLRDNGVDEATEADCFSIIRYFDVNCDQGLRYKDFLQMIMPCDDQGLRAEVAQRPNFEVPADQLLGPRVETELACLFEKEIALNRVMEEMRQEMHSNKQFDYSKAFAEIDDWSYGYIDKKNLKSFLRKHGVKAESADVVRIIRRMDLDGDARLTREEFIKAMLPSEPYSRLMRKSKEKVKSQSRYSEKARHQGANYMHVQDPVLNLANGQRDQLRRQAKDRTLDSGKLRARSANSYGNLGASAIKVRPDLHRGSTGLFAKDPADKLCSRYVPPRVLGPGKGYLEDGAGSASQYLLQRQYRDYERENYRRRREQGMTEENFKQERVWRPGGRAIGSRPSSSDRVSNQQLKQSASRRPKSAGKTLKKSKEKHKKVRRGGRNERPEGIPLAPHPPVGYHMRQDASITMQDQQIHSQSYEIARPDRPIARPNESLIRTAERGGHRAADTASFEAPPPERRSLELGRSGSRDRVVTISDQQRSIPSDNGLKQRSSPRTDINLEGGDRSIAAYTRGSQPGGLHAAGSQQSFVGRGSRLGGASAASLSRERLETFAGTRDFRDRDHQMRDEEQKRSIDSRGNEYKRAAHINQIRDQMPLSQKEQSERPPDYVNPRAIVPKRPSENNVPTRRPPWHYMDETYNHYRNTASNPLRKKTPSKSPARENAGPGYTAQGSPLRKPTPCAEAEVQHWVDCLMQLINQCRHLEAARMDLTCRKDFNLIDAFALLDLDGVGSVSRDEFFARVRSFAPEKQITTEDVRLVFKRHNKSCDGRLKFSEFMHALAPLHEEYQKILQERKPNKLYDKPKHAFQVFEGETFNTYIHAMWTLLETERLTENIRKMLRTRPLWTVHFGFAAIFLQSGPRPVDMGRAIAEVEKYMEKEALTSRNLMDLMTRYGHAHHLETLDYRLLIDRFDQDGDGLISFDEFWSMMQPDVNPY